MKFLGLPILVALAALILLVLSPTSEGAVQCSDVVKALRPCLDYLKNGSGKPPSSCCSSVSNLNSATTTTADRRAVCNCIKTAAQKIQANDALAKSLPGNCGITLSVPVSRSVDCSKVA